MARGRSLWKVISKESFTPLKWRWKVSGAEKLQASMLARWAWMDDARLWLTCKTRILLDGRTTNQSIVFLKVGLSMRCTIVILACQLPTSRQVFGTDRKGGEDFAGKSCRIGSSEAIRCFLRSHSSFIWLCLCGWNKAQWASIQLGLWSFEL